MDEEPTLPSFARANPIARRLDELTPSSPRKRARFSPPVSSDPPLFSSDDDPSADNYTTKRQKRKYRGPWFRQQPASDPPSDSNDNSQPVKGKRTLERQFDSGVFFGSDGTDVEDFADELVFEQDQTSETIEGLSGKIVLPLSSGKLFCTVRREEPDPEELARRQIQHCLEEGDEDIILSSLGLSSLSNITITPLETFTCFPRLSAGVTFESLIPDLKIFLASNRLKSLPAALLSLDRLTFLTLRDNRLEELPPKISHLKNLKELNVSQNSLNYLPFDILQLLSKDGSLRSIQLHPNPFYEPCNRSEVVEEEAEENTPTLDMNHRGNQAQIGDGSSTKPGAGSSKWHVAFNCRSQVRFRDISGALLKGPIFPKDTTEEKSRLQLPGALAPSNNSVYVADADDIPEPPTSRGMGPSRAPSLLEVALASCSKTPQLPDLPGYLPDDSPEHLTKLLHQAIAKKESGGSLCTICHRNFIVPRTEWIEWWNMTRLTDITMAASAASPLRQRNARDRVESMVPLIRRGCSWLCVPGKQENVRSRKQMVAKDPGLVNYDRERTMDMD